MTGTLRTATVNPAPEYPQPAATIAPCTCHLLPRWYVGGCVGCLANALHYLRSGWVDADRDRRARLERW